MNPAKDSPLLAKDCPWRGIRVFNMGHPNLDHNKIVKYIYIGTNQCCQTHFDARLMRKGVKADISLEKSRLDAPFGVDYYLWLPVADHSAPTARQLELGVRVLKFCVENKLPVYVHCKNGHGRAPTLVAAYLISTGQTVNAALAYLKTRRKVTHLNERQINTLKKFKLNL